MSGARSNRRSSAQNVHAIQGGETGDAPRSRPSELAENGVETEVVGAPGGGERAAADMLADSMLLMHVAPAVGQAEGEVGAVGMSLQNGAEGEGVRMASVEIQPVLQSL